MLFPGRTRFNSSSYEHPGLRAMQTKDVFFRSVNESKLRQISESAMTRIKNGSFLQDDKMAPLLTYLPFVIIQFC